MPQRCRGQVARNEGGPGARVQAVRFELMRLVPSEPVAESDRTLPAGARRAAVTGASVDVAGAVGVGSERVDLCAGAG
jgi:hypothetical protein